MSQTELARRVGIVPHAISKFEKDGDGIGDEKIAEIADVLGFDKSFFALGEAELPESGALSFRARTKMTARSREQARACAWAGIELSSWMDDNYILPDVDVPDLEGVDPEGAAAAVRSAWGLGYGPIPNVVSVLEAHGIRVFSVTETSQEIDAFSFWDERTGRPYVFLTTSKSGERRRMDASHELGHIVMHRKVDLVGRSKETERDANWFGGAFLMPREGFIEKTARIASVKDVMRAKGFWKVSAFAVVYRAHELGLLSDWQYHNLCRTMSSRGMRTNEPMGIEPERSQVTEKIISIERESSNGITGISKATEIPIADIESLTFRTPMAIVSGGGGSGFARADIRLV